uniref:uncharacterized protein C3orf38 homolog n=1 Tax=Styela clava TaxID=7725 RepID=UPI001939DF12|nr:uncharacterized protein C3orf38 homolog [Styela clava]
MITGRQKQGCVELLRMLPQHELIGLCDTVTNKLIASTNTEEAIDAILTYSKTVEELLNRKKLKHEILFQYLHSKNVGGINPKCTKIELVSVIIDFWSKGVVERNKHLSSHSTQKFCILYILNSSCIFTYNYHSYINPHEFQGQTSQQITINYNTFIHHEEKNVLNVVSASSVGDGLDTGQQLAKEFILWFYPMLNNIKNNQSPGWGAQNFCPDAVLVLTVIREGNNQHEEKFIGAQAAQEKLASLVMKDNAVLNPNTTPEGYRGTISPHGLAKVAVCGTLHKLNETCNSPNRQILMGVFEQCFGLVRDVSDGNRWKIKYTDLKMKLMSNYGQTPHMTLSEDVIRAISE